MACLPQASIQIHLTNVPDLLHDFRDIHLEALLTLPNVPLSRDSWPLLKYGANTGFSSCRRVASSQIGLHRSLPPCSPSSAVCVCVCVLFFCGAGGEAGQVCGRIDSCRIRLGVSNKSGGPLI